VAVSNALKLGTKPGEVEILSRLPLSSKHARIPQFSDLIMSRFDRRVLVLDDFSEVRWEIEVQCLLEFCHGAILSALALDQNAVSVPAFDRGP